MSIFQKNDIVLFQGDSITDTSRNRENDKFLGHGYPSIVTAICMSLCPEDNIRFINRGISGNTIRDLNNRIEEDFIEIKPDWISILIGINDCGRRYNYHNDPMSTEEFEEGYRNLLQRLKNETNAKFILCEPFLLNIQSGQDKWREDLDPKIEVVRKLSKEYDALLVPLDKIFKEIERKTDKKIWSEDGIHPTTAGHGLIAKAWLETAGII